jgi:hypothetical protein
MLWGIAHGVATLVVKASMDSAELMRFPGFGGLEQPQTAWLISNSTGL